VSYDYGASHWLDRFEGRFTPDMKIVLANAPITRFLDMRGRQETAFKPRGLWYACGNEWLEWLDTEMPSWKDQVTHVYQLFTAPLSPWPANGPVPLLRTAKDIDEFTEDYGKKDLWGIRTGTMKIDWAEVARDFPGGIEICPYQWARRRANNTSWYHGWDVASGCLWGPEGFQNLQLLATKPGIRA
jgi:hypothetical protein